MLLHKTQVELDVTEVDFKTKPILTFFRIAKRISRTSRLMTETFIMNIPDETKTIFASFCISLETCTQLY